MGIHRTRAYIGLGSNVGDPAAALAFGLRTLAASPRIRVAGVSRLYVTRPIGVIDQADFWNAAAAVDVRHASDPGPAALELLWRLKALEREAGRRPATRWGPRELDLDLLIFGRARIAIERPPDSDAAGRRPGRATAAPRNTPADPRLLEVPHPAIRERLFVLAPLTDLAPRLTPPGWTETIGRARRRVAALEGPDAVRVVGAWDPELPGWRLDPGPGLLRLRDAVPADASLVVSLTRTAYEEHRGRLEPPSGVFREDVEEVRRELEAGGGVVALLDGRPVGCARFVARPDLGHLYVGRVAVLSEARRRGIAEALLRHCETRAIAFGLPRVRVGARLALRRNVRFHQARGYRIVGYEERPGYGRIAAWLEKDIGRGPRQL